MSRDLQSLMQEYDNGGLQSALMLAQGDKAKSAHGMSDLFREAHDDACRREARYSAEISRRKIAGTWTINS